MKRASKSNFSPALLSLALLLSACATNGKKQISPEERASLHLNVANGALREGNARVALAHLIKAENLDAKSPSVQHSMALAFFMKNDFKSALERAKRATLIAPTYSAANNTLGRILIKMNKKNLAAEAPLTQAATDPLYKYAYKARTNLGILYYNRKNFQKSQEHLEIAIRDAPDLSCIAYYYRGHIKLRESKVQDSIKDYKRATIKYCGSFADAHLALGIAYARALQVTMARTKFLEVANMYPDTPIAEKAMKELGALP